MDRDIKRFLICYWNADTKDSTANEPHCPTQAMANHDLDLKGIRDRLKDFLLNIINTNNGDMEEWSDTCNITFDSYEHFRKDAQDFWNWLFEPVAK